MGTSSDNRLNAAVTVTEVASESSSAVRGRFDNSEPTIVNGEDLDVPTFLRKNLKITPRR
jgi:hypothetical protein